MAGPERARRAAGEAVMTALRRTTKGPQGSCGLRRRIKPDDGVFQRRRLKHLRMLAAMRYKGDLPDDVHGRNMLMAMLACGLTGPDAQTWAPWIKPQQLEDMIATVESREWNGDALGNLVELTDAEREEGKLFSMRPCDIDWAYVQARQSLTDRAVIRPTRASKIVRTFIPA